MVYFKDTFPFHTCPTRQQRNARACATFTLSWLRPDTAIPPVSDPGRPACGWGRPSGPRTSDSTPRARASGMWCEGWLECPPCERESAWGLSLDWRSGWGGGPAIRPRCTWNGSEVAQTTICLLYVFFCFVFYLSFQIQTVFWNLNSNQMRNLNIQHWCKNIFLFIYLFLI
jgi:hypothetical protein